MTDPLDVLLLESHPGAAAAAETELVAAGHRVHRCHDHTSRTQPCVGLTPGGSCPLDGPIDVALDVRQHITPRPTPLEDGVTCAAREGIPLVIDGSDLLDPFAQIATAHVRGHVAEACTAAVEDALRPLAAAAQESLHAFLTSRGHDVDAAKLSFEARGPRLVVRLGTDGLDRAMASLLAVRALDAIRPVNRRWKKVDVVWVG